jgi:tetratricopeptide (TPR) repeat protein
MVTNDPLKKSARASRSLLLGVVLFASLLVLAGCVDFLSGRESDIRDATQALERARDDAQRAKAYSSRGTAYSEKARYSRISKLISDDAYERLFGLAIKDHDQAVALNPANAEVYFKRAQTYYDRGSLDLIYVINPFESEPRNNHGSTRRLWISRRPPKKIPKIPSPLTCSA